MRNRVWAVAAALVLTAGSVPAQDAASPVRELPPSGANPLNDPFFAPTDRPEAMLGPPDGALSDAVAPRGPFRLPSILAPCSEFFSCAASEESWCPPEFATWLTAEWLIGRARGTGLVPVVTTGPAAAGALAGAVGQPGTVSLFGGRRVLNDWRSGLRVETGIWFDPDRTSGASARVYSLFSTSDRLALRPDGTAVVNVPQFVPAGGATVQFPAFVAFPGLTTGSVSALARSTFIGGDVSLRRLIGRGDGYRVELLGGYRHMYLRDELNLAFNTNAIGVNAALTPQLSGSDFLSTRNNFGGPQLGLYASTGGKRFLLEGHAAMALGVTVSDIDYARGRTASAGPPGNPLALAGALASLGVPLANAAQVAAANPAQFGQVAINDTRTYFGVVGEGGVRAKWFVTDYMRLTAGYSFLYWNNVRRGPQEFTGGPTLRAWAADFTTHLFSVGLEVRY